MKKRIIALLLAVVVCLSTVCMMGAAETEQEIEIQWIELPGELRKELPEELQDAEVTQYIIKPTAYNQELGLVTFYNSYSNENFVIDIGTGELQPEIEYYGAPSEGLSRIKIGNDEGYVDSEGNMVISGDYLIANSYDFSDGLACVKMWDENTESFYEYLSCGFIDKAGKEVIPFGEYDDAFPFSDGLAAVAKYDKEKGQLKWGFINTEGNVKIPCEYEFESAGYYRPWGFAGGVCPMMQEGKWGVINTEGEIVIPFAYNWISCFDSGLALVRLSDGFINAVDTSGHMIISRHNKPWRCCGYPGNSLIPVYDESLGKLGFINGYGNIVIPFEYDLADSGNPVDTDIGFRSGISVVRKMDAAQNPFYGFIDTAGTEIVPIEYDQAGNMDSCGWVRKGDRYGIFENPYWGQETEIAGVDSMPILVIGIAAVAVIILVTMVAVIVVKRKKKAGPTLATENIASQEPPVAPTHPSLEHNFCTTCGSPLPEGCRFCPKCGKEVEK